MPARPIHAAALIVACLPLSGCGPTIERPRTIPVEGKVTYKGKAVPKGTVTFLADDGTPAVGDIQEDGSYRIGTFEAGDGALPGHHKVYIVANTGDGGLMPGSSPDYKKPVDLIPQKYQSQETSGLEANVSEENKAIDFDLK